MNQIKKHSIGYNTVSSADGIINARGVKSKPDNIQIFGYTHEIGEGKKSPDNPYILSSLDGGDLNLYSEDKITDIQVTNDGIIRKGFAIDASEFKSKYCSIYFDEENSSQIPSVAPLNRGINIKFLYKNGTYETFKTKNFIKSIRTDKITENVKKVIIYNAGSDTHAEYFSFYIDLMILDSPIIPNEYITDKHSIALSNNNTNIQVPVPIPLKSVDSVSDYIFKDKNGVWKLKQMCKTFNSTDNIDTLTLNTKLSTGVLVYRIGVQNDGLIGNRTAVKTNMLDIVSSKTNRDNIAKFFIISDARITVYIRYGQRQYVQFSDVETLKAWLLENPFEIIYRAITQEEYILSDYAQDLLNSFTLQNNNKIWVEGYPDIKISGYIQK